MTHFYTDDGTVHALNGISDDLGPGETVRVVAEGARGKTFHGLSTLQRAPPCSRGDRRPLRAPRLGGSYAEMIRRPYRVVYVDTFTRLPFAGNPCAVLPDASGLTHEQMEAIAREVNLPETAFVFPSVQADFRVRYFTPRSELPFAGHPTIATAFVLAEEGLTSMQQPTTTISLEFAIGVLPVEIRISDGRPGRVIMTQPSPTFGETFAVEHLALSLGLRSSDSRSDCLPQVVGTGLPFLITAVRDVGVLGRIEMDREALAAVCDEAGVSAAFAFSIGGFDPGADTHARLFDPRGIIEDPFTGSAAGAMGSYVLHHGLKGGPTLVAEQGHFVGRPGRGILEFEVDDGKIESVRLGGAAVSVLHGTFSIPEPIDEVNI